MAPTYGTPSHTGASPLGFPIHALKKGSLLFSGWSKSDCNNQRSSETGNPTGLLYLRCVYLLKIKPGPRGNKSRKKYHIPKCWNEVCRDGGSMYTYIHIYPYTHICMYAHVHTYTSIYVCICMLMSCLICFYFHVCSSLCGICALKVGSQSFKCETWSQCVRSGWVSLGVISDFCTCVFQGACRPCLSCVSKSFK